jgi:hypothetical protein
MEFHTFITACVQAIEIIDNEVDLSIISMVQA